MFGKKELKEQIEFLKQELSKSREDNKELRLQLIALSNKSSEYFNTKLASKRIEPKKIKDVNDVIENINGASPYKDEDILSFEKRKERAKKIAQKVFTGV